MADLTELQSKLDARPEDWDLRLQIIEKLSRRDRLDEARELVRTSPEGPVPYHIQTRLWDALSGTSTVKVVDDGSGNADAKPNLIAKAKIVDGPGAKKADAKSDKTVSRVPPPPTRAKPEEKEDPSVPQPYQHSKETSDDDTGIKLAPAPKLRRQVPAAAGGKQADRRFAMAGLEDVSLPNPRRKRRTGSVKFSAMTMAVIVHLFFVVGTAFVTVFIPGARAPVIAMIPAPPAMEDEVLKTKIVQKTDISKPAAPSAAATAVITVEAESTFVAPQFDKINKSFDANLIDSGVGMSRGFSFEGEGVESNVNFFGLEAGGRRICFIIDAEPAMLLDEKGGMFAYNKVKGEIGAMLETLSRGTAFNIIVYQGKRMSIFRETPVRALPSNVRRAKQWMEPVNQNYEALGLRENFTMEGIKTGAEPIHFNDISGHVKAIQAAMEQDVNAIFCISNGFTRMSRSLSPEDQAMLAEYNQKRSEEVAASREGYKPQYDPKEVAAWQAAQKKARDWLEKENAARREKGMAPKVVLSMSEILKKVAPGARAPRPLNDPPPPPPPSSPPPEVTRMPAYTTEDIETHLANIATANYGKNQPSRPAVNLVLWLAEGEDIGQYEDHFKTLTRRNKGKLKILRGLDALADVTGT